MRNNLGVEERARSGGPEEQFTRGVEALGQARSIEDAARAAELIEAAADAGYAPATERCAIIECMGIGRPINWHRALDRVAQAATQGSELSARQLLLLAGQESSTGGDWSVIRGRIDADALVGARKGIVALERPFIQVFQAFATPAECRWLIETAHDRLGPSTVYDYSTGALRPDPRRTSRAAMFTFDQIDLVTEVIRARISASLRLPLQRFEVSQVLHYAPGQEFNPHHDYFDPAAEGFQEEIALRGQRVATLLIYLNDAFEGGQTHFPSLGFSYRGEIGDSIAFFSVDSEGQPESLTLHAGLPPTSGEKWIFSQWVRDRRSQG
ncbi:MAG TPA: 2OG-Fe(II) oxygenase [Sphingomicrobium sp.]|nr:2OG-Fe(II) oxygenase [Sphingomicrobium sp.]